MNGVYAVALGLLVMIYVYWGSLLLRDLAGPRAAYKPLPGQKLIGFHPTIPIRYLTWLTKHPAKAVDRMLMWTRVFVTSDNLVHWMSPVMVVVFPVRLGYVLFTEPSFGWRLLAVAIYLAWTWIAYREMKKDGPRWKKRGRKIASKVTVTAGGLRVVPVKAR
jgi:hypothetical protein